MSIRKFRKHMKPVILILTILFIVSFVSMYVVEGIYSESERLRKLKAPAFVLNGETIPKSEVERVKSVLTNNYLRVLGGKDKEIISVIAMDNVIDKNLTLEMAKNYKIQVSDKLVDEIYNKEERQIGNKKDFTKILMYKGFTKYTFKKEIKNELIINELLKKLREGVSLNEQEIEQFYNKNRQYFNNVPLSEVKEQIIIALKNEKVALEYQILLEKYKNKAKIEDISPDYENFKRSVVIDKDGFKVTNVELDKRILKNVSIMGGEIEKATKLAKDYYEREIKVAKLAIARGVKVNPDLPLDIKFYEYNQGLFEKIKHSINPTERDLKNYFSKNSKKYDVLPSAVAKIVQIGIFPSQEDIFKSKNEASDILKMLTPKNFSEKAKKYSEGPSAKMGGELGWISENDIDSVFKEVFENGKKGEVYPEVIDSKYGFNLVYVKDINKKTKKMAISHILIIPKVSDKTIEDKLKEIETIKGKILEGTVNLDTLSRMRNDVVRSGVFKVDSNGDIQGFGKNKKLAKAIFDEPLKKLASVIEGNKIYIFDKIEETEYKNITYDEVKKIVREDYLNEKAQEVMKKQHLMLMEKSGL